LGYVVPANNGNLKGNIMTTTIARTIDADATLALANALVTLEANGFDVSTLKMRESAPITREVPATITLTPSVQRTPKAPTASKSADKRDWRIMPASAPQIGRIERAEEAILESGRKRGIKLIAIGAERKSAMANAGNASDYYKSLASFTRKFAITF
jgi:hypothetical protein